MEAQGIAVAEAVGLPFSLRRVRVTGVDESFVPAPLQLLVPPARLLGSVAANEPLEAPWPRLIISIGRRSVPIALAIKRLGAPKVFALHIQNPKVPARLFDLIAAPVHDGFEAPNVITTFGAVHSVTGDRLAEAGKRFAPRVSIPAPPPHRGAARRREPSLQLPASSMPLRWAPNSRPPPRKAAAPCS